jgi:2-dehydropantoate 2-reductase
VHVVVVGAGAVGKLYGGWLLAGGVDVSFVARGASLEALRGDGLTLRGDRGELRLGPVAAEEAPEALRPADAVVLAVKLYDLPEAAGIAGRCILDDGLVVGLQNGVGAFGLLAEALPPDRIAVGPVYSAARQVSPGTVEYSGARHLVVLGSPRGEIHPAAHSLVAGWRRAGVEAEISGDIDRVLWTKFLGFATNAALTCLSRQPAGVVYHDPDLLELARGSVREIMALAAAEGVALAADAEDATIRLLRSFPPDMVASMRQDLDAGRRLELDDVTGAIVRSGRRHGIPTPIHATAYACLKPYRDGVPPSIRSDAHAE